MNPNVKKVVKFVVRWGIAVGGIWWVIANMSLRDSVLVIDPQTNLPHHATLVNHADEDATQFQIVDPKTGKIETVERSSIINPATARKLQISLDGKSTEAQLLGMRLSGDINHNPTVQQLLVKLPGNEQGVWIFPSDVIGGFRLDVPRPRVEVGIISMVKGAEPWLLVLAIFVFPITLMITSYRWHRLLEAVDVHMSLWRTFVINMVGAFYNTFMPGSTGGDVLKAYYASKQTPHRMRAIMSVVVDRLLGLIALVMLGGVMASYQYLQNPTISDPTSRECLHVALLSAAIIGGLVIVLAILFQPTLRTWLGLEFILRKLPMQRQIESARQVMRMYRDQPLLVAWALLVTIPVHVTVVLSALLCGKAFDLPLRPLYYFTAVPVIVLVGSIPISPQGAGVMEFFAIALTQKQGATVSQ
ncbi:MAG TPA: lysylphosphatidylglycerol synthase transmembrane domain-containing protein, partial [Tepidisphaeraceae bacterium]|nr:lysylphosphatidylglycerol synthase transmembrane domain-containing protein [Tepidisphaeraceae bacterium]